MIDGFLRGHTLKHNKHLKRFAAFNPVKICHFLLLCLFLSIGLIGLEAVSTWELSLLKIVTVALLLMFPIYPYHPRQYYILWKRLVLSVRLNLTSLEATLKSTLKNTNRGEPWLRPPPFLPSSDRLWSGSCSARTCSRRSIVFSAISGAPRSNSRSPRRRPSAPLLLRSYPKNAARSWGGRNAVKSRVFSLIRASFLTDFETPFLNEIKFSFISPNGGLEEWNISKCQIILHFIN